MKKVLIGLLLVGNSAFAVKDVFEIKVDLTKSGKVLSDSTVITNLGEAASINQKGANTETKIELVSSKSGDMGTNDLLLNLKISIIEKGQKSKNYSTKVAVRENIPATFPVGPIGSPEELTMRILVSKKAK